MAQSVRDVMTPDPATVPASATVADAARLMDERDIGDVLVVKDGQGVCGIVTDRDIVIRAIAPGRDPSTTRVDDICSHELVSVESSAAVGDAVRLMRERAIRRVAVVEAGRPVGIVSIGDLAIERDPGSALADISAAPPNE